jgi:hypothetical protein
LSRPNLSMGHGEFSLKRIVPLRAQFVEHWRLKPCRRFRNLIQRFEWTCWSNKTQKALNCQDQLWVWVIASSVRKESYLFDPPTRSAMGLELRMKQRKIHQVTLAASSESDESLSHETSELEIFIRFEFSSHHARSFASQYFQHHKVFVRIQLISLTSIYFALK